MALPRGGMQDEATHGAVSGRLAAALLGSPHLFSQGDGATDARQAPIVEAPIILALGSLGAVAVLRVTQGLRRLARSTQWLCTFLFFP